MPRDIARVFRCRVHRPAHKPRTVAFLKDSCDLPVSHNAAARDSHDKPIYLLEYLIETGRAGRRGDGATESSGDAATRRGGDRANRIAPSPRRPVAASLFLHTGLLMKIRRFDISEPIISEQLTSVMNLMFGDKPQKRDPPQMPAVKFNLFVALFSGQVEHFG